MKRTTKPANDPVFQVMEKADAILTGDWHLQDSTPVCRTDEFWDTIWRKLAFISSLQKHHDCDVLHSGDLTDYWKPSPMLLSMAIEHLPQRFKTIYGNHDLPQHSLDKAYKCGIHTLEKANALSVIEGGSHWLQEPEEAKVGIKGRSICIWHKMNYQGALPYPGCTDPRSASLLKKYPQFDLILTGHNHKPFTEKSNGRLLVNPGSIFRLSSDQIDFKPRVYLYYAKTNSVVPVYLPIEKDAVTREHLDVVEERNDRIEAFISSLDDNWEVGMSFEDNLERFFAENDVRKSVKELIYESIGK